MNKNCKITGLMVHEYFVCKRTLWFTINNLPRNYNNDWLKEGRLIDQLHKAKRDYYTPAGKIDLQKSGQPVEIKKSSKFLKAAIWQLKHYLYQTGKKSGVLKIPKEKKRFHITLTQHDIKRLHAIYDEICKLATAEKPPAPVITPKCYKCAYRDYCLPVG